MRILSKVCLPVIFIGHGKVADEESHKTGLTGQSLMLGDQKPLIDVDWLTQSEISSQTNKEDILPQIV